MRLYGRFPLHLSVCPREVVIATIICLIGVSSPVSALGTFAEQGGASQVPPPKPAEGSETTPAKKQTSPQPAAKPSKANNASQPAPLQGDYIPCKFTAAELKSLESPGISPVLSERDGETVKQQAIDDALALTAINGPVIQEFIRRVSAETLGGLTPTEALNRVIADLSAAQGMLRGSIPPNDPLDSASIRALVNSTRTALALLEGANDVGCTMSILGYEETDMAYGHKIAGEYIAVQVIVRNLNRNQAFVVHDAEFQVNSDPERDGGRFFSGRDKVIVRALSATQSSFDPRALWVHIAMGIGTTLTAAAPIFGVASLTNATGVFNSAVVPALDKYWKDLSTDQLNLLNDTGFSAQLNAQTSVPALGTVLFVIFVPSEQFREGWWTQPCVEKIYVGSTSNGALTPVGSKSSGGDGGGERVGTSKDPEPVARDYAGRALEACLAIKGNTSGAGPAFVFGGSDKEDHVTAVPRGIAMDGDVYKNADLFRDVRPRKYEHWSPSSLQLFADLSNVVVLGTHITENSELEPSVSALDCPKDNHENITLPSTDTLTCPISGKNLEKIGHILLRDSTNSDPMTAQGPVTVTGGHGTVVFTTADLGALPQPAYSVFAVPIATGVELPGGPPIHLLTSPVVKNVSPPAIDFSKNSTAAQTLTVTGYHLGKVDTVELTEQGKTVKVDIPVAVDSSRKDDQLAVSLDPTKALDPGEQTLSKTFGTTQVKLDVVVLENKASFSPSPAVSFEFTGAPEAKSSGTSKPTSPPASVKQKPKR